MPELAPTSMLPPSPRVLASHEVHIWRTCLDRSNIELAYLWQALAADECLRAKRFHAGSLFHVSNLEPHVRDALLAAISEEDLPRNAYYGDGTPIETSILDEIRQAYQGVAVQFPWQQGDVLMLDNMLVAHGRAPYKGARKILVAMAEPYCEK
jgi:hypothetical protein